MTRAPAPAKRATLGWVAVNPGGLMLLWAGGFTRQQTQSHLVDVMGGDWARLKANGYQIVRCEFIARPPAPKRRTKP